MPAALQIKSSLHLSCQGSSSSVLRASTQLAARGAGLVKDDQCPLLGASNVVGFHLSIVVGQVSLQCRAADARRACREQEDVMQTCAARRRSSDGRTLRARVDDGARAVPAVLAGLEAAGLVARQGALPASYGRVGRLPAPADPRTTPAEPRMQFRLRGDDVGRDLAVLGDHRGGGLVAGRLEAEDQHRTASRSGGGQERRDPAT